MMTQLASADILTYTPSSLERCGKLASLHQTRPKFLM